MKEHHLQLNLAKTELLVFPATPSLQHDFTIQLGSPKITPSVLVRNLGVIFYDQLTFKEHIAKTAQSCRFALHNVEENSFNADLRGLIGPKCKESKAVQHDLVKCNLLPLQERKSTAARL